MRKASTLHRGAAAHTPGPCLREAEGENPAVSGGARSLDAAPCQQGEQQTIGDMKDRPLCLV